MDVSHMKLVIMNMMGEMIQQCSDIIVVIGMKLL